MCAGQSATPREEVQAFWGCTTTLSPKPGLTATEMFTALEEGRLKAIWIVGSNPLVSLPDVRRLKQPCRKQEFVVSAGNIRTRPKSTAIRGCCILPRRHLGGEGRNDEPTPSAGSLTCIRSPMHPARKPCLTPASSPLLRRRCGYHGFSLTTHHQRYMKNNCRRTAGTRSILQG